MWAALGILVEMVGPDIAERGKGGTPWHAHHIAERYGLLTIITLGEGVIGTVASLSAVVESQGWSRDACSSRLRERGSPWGCGGVFHHSFGGGAACACPPRAGIPLGLRPHPDLWLDRCQRGRPPRCRRLHGHEAHIGATATMLTVAIPVAVFVPARAPCWCSPQLSPLSARRWRSASSSSWSRHSSRWSATRPSGTGT